MKTILGAVLFAIWIPLSAAGLEPYSDKPVAFVGVNVIPMTSETVILNQTVLIKDGIITTIGNAEDVKIPRRAQRIDCEDKYLIPGLIDLHAHLFAGRKGNPQLLSLYLSQGVTSILNLRGTKGALALGAQIDSGELVGPEIYQGSPIQGNIAPTPATYEDGVKVVQKFKKEGYDFVKTYNRIPVEGYRGIMDAADELDMPVVGHTVRLVGFDGILARGQHIAHMEEVIYGAFRYGLDESRIPEVTKQVKDSGVSVIATLIVYHNIIRQLDDIQAILANPGFEHIHPALADNWQPDRDEYLNGWTQKQKEVYLIPSFAFLQKLTLAFHKAGVPILMGTDACVTGTIPGHSAHRELEELADCGLSNYDALASATSKAADFLSAGDIGTIQEGKRADLILLNADPLEDITNSSKIEGIMTRGLWQTQEEIRGRLVDY
ncbi:MAG: amidohydrolase family protein [Candidatus Hydrogenedentota bacterium]